MRKFKQMRHLKKIIARSIIFADKFINLYLYFIVVGCLLSWIPNINPNYPLFNFIFKACGFYLLPPFLGFTVAPVLIMMTLVLISMGLTKLYFKYFAPKEPQIIVLTKDEFEKQLGKFNEMMADDLIVHEIEIEDKEDKNDDNS